MAGSGKDCRTVVAKFGGGRGESSYCTWRVCGTALKVVSLVLWGDRVGINAELRRATVCSRYTPESGNAAENL